MEIRRTAVNLNLLVERWPIAGTFAISRGAKTEAVVVLAELGDGKAKGCGECVPYARYGESVETVSAAIEAMRPRLAQGLSRVELQSAMPPGRPVHELAGLPVPKPRTTAFTISLGTPEVMAQAASASAGRALLKIKLGGNDEHGGDLARIAAVRIAAPNAVLIVDANEGWRAGNLAANLAACAKAGVVLVEQPLPEGQDDALAGLSRPIPVCADESVHDRRSLAALAGKYDAVNIKLDKTGGLTEALAMATEAAQAGFAVMVGCMVATSLAMAPAVLLAQAARFVDLDGPLLLAKDRACGLVYRDSLIYPATPALWG